MPPPEYYEDDEIVLLENLEHGTQLLYVACTGGAEPTAH